jgi:endonuclease-3
MNSARVRAIFSYFAAENPHPKTELQYDTDFELLIAVMLSAQATDKSVNQATAILFKQANTPAALLAFGEKKLKDAIKTIGLYNSKAKHILESCAILLEKHQGKVPHDRAALEALPGVGRKTANVVLNTAFGEATIAVDTHIFRVARRLGLSAGKTPLKVEDDLLACIPENFRRHAHHWLILHGRYICQARKPRCGECPIRRYCDYPNNTKG